MDRKNLMASSYLGEFRGRLQAGPLVFFLLAGLAGTSACGPVRPEGAQGYIASGQARLSRGDVGGALADFERACALEPTNAKAQFLRGHALSRKGDVNAAIAATSRAIELDPSNPAAWNNRGAQRNRIKDYDAAIADCTKALELNPRLPVVYNTRAYSYRESGRAEWAIRDYERAVEMDPKYAQAYRNLASLRAELGDSDGAIRDFGRAIEADPRTPWAYDERGLLYFNRRSWSESLADFQKACALSDTQRCCARLYSWLIRARLGERAAADQELRTALRGDTAQPGEPWHREWYRKAGEFLLGDLAESEFLFLGDRMTPDHATSTKCSANFYVGMKRLLGGDREGARIHLQHSVEHPTKECREVSSAASEIRALGDPR
jgi:tetratricopeptide (TPR) repeat protein